LITVAAQHSSFSPHPFTTASLAYSSPTGLDAQVLSTIGMSGRTKLLFDVTSGKRIPSPLILACRNRLKMIWPNAKTISAEMVDLKSIWNFPYKELVSKPMRTTELASVDSEVSVPPHIFNSSPYPASLGFVYPLPEFLDYLLLGMEAPSHMRGFIS
jgi:hypothetical protein